MIVLRFLSLTISAYLLPLSIMGAFHFTHQLRPKWPFVINFKADLSLGTLTYRLSVGSETPTYPKRPAPQASRSERYSCSQHLLRSTWRRTPKSNHDSFLLDENSKNDGLSVFGNDVHKSFWTMSFTTDPFVRSFPRKTHPWLVAPRRWIKWNHGKTSSWNSSSRAAACVPPIAVKNVTDGHHQHSRRCHCGSGTIPEIMLETGFLVI